MFRDQTELVTRKARSTNSSSAASTSSSSARQPTSAFPIQSSTCSVTGSSVSFDEPIFDYGVDPELQFYVHQARQQSPLGTNPDMGVSKQEAICFFLQSHAIAGNFLITDTLTNFLMESGGSLGQQAIQSSIVAVASALLARVRGAAVLRQAARQEYGTALQLVNRALADANEAKTNQTLAAVVLLALYEVSRLFEPKEASSNVSRSSHQELHKALRDGRTIFVEPQPFFNIAVLHNGEAKLESDFSCI